MADLPTITWTAGVPDTGQSGTVMTVSQILGSGPKTLTDVNSSLTTLNSSLSDKSQFSKVTDGTDTLLIDAHGSAQTTLLDSSGNAVPFNSNQTAAYAKSSGAAPVMLPGDQDWKTGMSNKVFVAAFTTNTRPANTTPYTAGDSISNNATAGSVTALSATISDTNDDPIFIADILISSTDTGLAGKRIRAYLFNSDPTASSGVGGGDNAAFSQKIAGYIGSFSGVLETGFSDGTVGRLVPAFNDSTASPSQNASANGFICLKPTSGAKTLYIQYQAMDAFTPSANSTTIIGTARGWQARAA